MIVVAGSPRSGTSLTMQVLAAGGLDAVTSRRGKEPRDINRRGLWEFAVALNHPVEATEDIVGDPTKCIKLFYRPLRVLIEGGRLPTAVVFTDRNAKSVHASQKAALQQATPAADLVRIRRRVESYVESTGVPTTRVSFARLISDPAVVVAELAAFLAPLTPVALDVDAMAGVPDSDLVHF